MSTIRRWFNQIALDVPTQWRQAYVLQFVILGIIIILLVATVSILVMRDQIPPLVQQFVLLTNAAAAILMGVPWFLPGKQMLYIHGDTHTARFGPKLTPVYPSPTQLTPAGTPYANFYRLEVYAQTAAFSNWFKVSVNPDGTYAVTAVPVP